MLKSSPRLVTLVLAALYFVTAGSMLLLDWFEAYFVLIFPWSWLLTISGYLLIHILSDGELAIRIGMWIGAVINAILLGHFVHRRLTVTQKKLNRMSLDDLSTHLDESIFRIQQLRDLAPTRFEPL
jgi:hypothetical protein